MKPFILVFLFLLLVIFGLLSIMAMSSQLWAESSCMGVWFLIIWKVGEAVQEDMK